MQSCAQAGRPAARRGVVTSASWAPLGKHTPHRLFVFGLGYTGLGGCVSRGGRTPHTAGAGRRVGRRAGGKLPLLCLPAPTYTRLYYLPRLGSTAGAASFFQNRGWAGAGTCRTEEKRARLAERGIDAFHFDPADFENLRCLPAHIMHVCTSCTYGCFLWLL